MWRAVAILAICALCLAAGKTLRSPKDAGNQPVAPTTVRVLTAPAPPAAAIAPTKTNAWTHLAVTATGTNGLESDYSKEVVLTNKASYVALAWDRVTNTPIQGYTVYVGLALTNYTRKIPVGNVTNATVALVPTNFVLTVTTKNATNLAWSNDLKTWNKIGATNYCSTNGPTRQWWRAYGKQASEYIKTALSF